MSDWLTGIWKKYWLPGVGGALLLLNLVSLLVVWQNVLAMEKNRYLELVDFTRNISETAQTFIENKQYEDFYKIIRLLTRISYLKYIGVFLGDTKVLQVGDETVNKIGLPVSMIREGKTVGWDRSDDRFYVNQRLDYHQQKPAHIITVFSLAEFQRSKQNIIYVSFLILVLMIFLAACLFGLLKFHYILRRTEETKSLMIRAISHDAMHILNPIYSTIYSLVEQQDGRVEPQRLNKDLKQIRENVHSIKRVLENLRDNERLNQGGFQIRTERLDLCQWIRFMVDNFEVTLAVNNLRVELDLPETPVDVLTDKESLKSVLMNLIDNAIKYSDEGKTIKIWVETNPGWVEVFIRDQGLGIAPQYWEQIFKPFSRLTQTVKKIEGSGLGLSNSRLHLRMHGGDMGIAASEPGIGTTFYFRLPVYTLRRAGG